MNGIAHPLPFSLFLSNLAIFAFKKKGRGAEVEEISDELKDIDFDDGFKLNENGDLDFGGQTSDLGEVGDDAMELGVPEEPTPDAGTPKKRLDEMNAAITDLREQMEKDGLQIKGARNDIDALKAEMEQINESMKKMLCVYEAVSREYNPFVDAVTAKGEQGSGKERGPPLFKGKFSEDEEDLDRIIKPEGTAERHIDEKRRARETEQRIAASTVSIANPLTPPRGDFYSECWRRIGRMVELMNEKEATDRAVENVYMAFLNDARPAPRDLERLEDLLVRARR